MLGVVGALVDLVVDEDILMLQKVNLFLQLLALQRVLLRGVEHEADLQIVKVLALRRFDEIFFHGNIGVDWEGVIVDGELLERRAVGVSVQPEAMLFFFLLVVVGVLVLREEEVIVEAASFEAQKLAGDVVEDLIFLLELLQLFVELQEFDRVNFIFLLNNALLLFHGPLVIL